MFFIARAIQSRVFGKQIVFQGAHGTRVWVIMPGLVHLSSMSDQPSLKFASIVSCVPLAQRVGGADAFLRICG